MNYRLVVGLETHIQLNTKTKLFCSCLNEYAPNDPNKNICPFCTGQPGALPVMNKEAVKKSIIFGVALGAKIPEITKWDRKNYFYPDSPNGYQISQYDHPVVLGGSLNFYIEDKNAGSFTPSSVQITRAHLESDAAKLIHVSGKTMVDFNRMGCPLIEVVTEPCIHSKEQAMAYVNELQLLVRKLNISDADMEKGQMRFDCNISLQNEEEEAQNKLPGYRVEIKNINSVRSLGRVIEYEINRQTKLLEAGTTPDQETRGWDDDKGVSNTQRSKEDAMDYRYFPEPDILALKIRESDLPNINELKELPFVQRERYIESGLNVQTANIFVEREELGNLFDNASSGQNDQNTKTIANIITTQLIPLVEEKENFDLNQINPSNLKILANLFNEEKINNKGLSVALNKMIEMPNEDVMEIIEKEGLMQVNDDSVLEAFVDAVFLANPDPVSQLKSGKEQVMGFLIGQCMKESKGQGNPQKFTQIIKRKINE